MIVNIGARDYFTLVEAQRILKRMCKNSTSPEERCAKDLEHILSGFGKEGRQTVENRATLNCPAYYTIHPSAGKLIESGLAIGKNISDLSASLLELQEIIAKTDFDQTVVVEEECTELLKEICKFRRGKGNREHLMEESIDVVTACMVYNQVCGGSLEDLIEKATMKVKRAIKRHEANGEM